MNVFGMGPKLLVRIKLFLTGATYVGFLSQFFHPLNYHLFLMIQFEMSLENILVGELLITLRTRMQPFHIHLTLMTQKFFLRFESFVAGRTFKWIVFDVPLVGHTVPVMILVGMFFNLFMTIQWEVLTIATSLRL